MATKRTAPAAETPPPEPPPEEEPGGGEVSEDKIREVVREMLASLGITDDGAGNEPGETDPEAAGGKPRTQAAVEADVEGKVRAAIEKLRGEEDRDRRIAALEERTAEPERSPIKERVSTRLMGWGRSRA